MIYTIETTREQMLQVAAEKNDFTDEAVVKMSQCLDIYLVEYQKNLKFSRSK
ncbi:aspartyl-phosphate phosphatase Spo0E family protein [Paenibacillus alvei]|uniref:aspartyl-phosphate phosphatase Spo0E family protein n=1 Tax=Paenibacillus alvei TaxID=44250 RepID=UPI0023B02739|nr:aspartyl-phosphate phosphatase Spo0E family protein [Paenibacillus alvei]